MTTTRVKYKSTEHKFLWGDNLVKMLAMEDAFFDLLITSPPYRAGKNYSTYDDVQTLDEYRAFARKWMAQAVRLVRKQGSVWINLGYTKLGENETLPLTYLYHAIASELGLKLVQEVVWHFEGGMSYKRRFSHRTERWLWLTLDPDNVYFDLDAVRDPRLNRTKDKRNNPKGKNPTDYWYFDRVAGGAAKTGAKMNHPCQFPVPMIERIIKACSPVGGEVLDPFGGVGSTAVAAARTKRSSVLIDIDENYRVQSVDRFERPVLEFFDQTSQQPPVVQEFLEALG